MKGISILSALFRVRIPPFIYLKRLVGDMVLVYDIYDLWSILFMKPSPSPRTAIRSLFTSTNKNLKKHHGMSYPCNCSWYNGTWPPKELLPLQKLRSFRFNDLPPMVHPRKLAAWQWKKPWKTQPIWRRISYKKNGDFPTSHVGFW